MMGCDNGKKEAHCIAYDSGLFLLDSSVFVVGAVDFPYYGIPRSYWERTIGHVKEMGANTVMLRLPWMLHEPKEGSFNFEEENDVRLLCDIAADNGLLVWLHVGPFIDKRMDFGGMPWWLLKDKDIRVRTLQQSFMDRVGRYFRALAVELSGMQLGSGGPIAFVNIEEPYYLNGNVKGYFAALYDSLRVAGFDNSLFTLSVSKENLLKIPSGVLPALVADERENAMRSFSGVKKVNHDFPVICNDINNTTKDASGVAMDVYDYNRRYMRAFEVFEANGSLLLRNVADAAFYGHQAGAAVVDGKFLPYAALIGEGAVLSRAGYRGDEARRLSELLKRNVTQMSDMETKPQSNRLMMLPAVSAEGFSSLFATMPKPIESAVPLTFEECGFGYGAVCYSAYIPCDCEDAFLSIDGLHDYARVYIDETYLCSFSRNDSVASFRMPALKSGARLSILVDAAGRLPHIKDCKGITGGVTLSNVSGEKIVLDKWYNYSFPSQYDRVASLSYTDDIRLNEPGCFRFLFDVSECHDSYLYMGAWGRGEVWVNGHSLGCYYGNSSVQSLYMPGCWLKKGSNEIIVLDWVGTDNPVIEAYRSEVIYM